MAVPRRRPAKPVRPKVSPVAKPRAPRIAAAHRSSIVDLAAQERLEALGAALEETAQAYVARLRREIGGVAEALPACSGRKTAKIARLLEGFHIKAHKGRRKDLKKIDLLIGELQRIVED